jgi:hypothetical protein
MAIIKTEIKRLACAFPATPDEFYPVLMDMVQRDGFTVKRIKDAVDNAIRNYKYPTLSASEILSYDKTMRLYHYAEVLKMIEGGLEWNDFEIVKQENEKPKWKLR